METLTTYWEVIGNPNSFVEYDLPTQETLLDNNTQFFPGVIVIIFQHKMQVVICIISSQLFNLNTKCPRSTKAMVKPLKTSPQHTITIAALNLYQVMCVTKAGITARGFAFIQECSRRQESEIRPICFNSIVAHVIELRSVEFFLYPKVTSNQQNF